MFLCLVVAINWFILYTMTYYNLWQQTETAARVFARDRFILYTGSITVITIITIVHTIYTMQRCTIIVLITNCQGVIWTSLWPALQQTVVIIVISVMFLCSCTMTITGNTGDFYKLSVCNMFLCLVVARNWFILYTMTYYNCTREVIVVV